MILNKDFKIWLQNELDLWAKSAAIKNYTKLDLLKVLKQYYKQNLY